MDRILDKGLRSGGSLQCFSDFSVILFGQRRALPGKKSIYCPDDRSIEYSFRRPDDSPIAYLFRRPGD